jgi:hypothetical protein
MNIFLVGSDRKPRHFLLILSFVLFLSVFLFLVTNFYFILFCYLCIPFCPFARRRVPDTLSFNLQPMLPRKTQELQWHNNLQHTREKTKCKTVPIHWNSHALSAKRSLTTLPVLSSQATTCCCCSLPKASFSPSPFLGHRSGTRSFDRVVCVYKKHFG